MLASPLQWYGYIENDDDGDADAYSSLTQPLLLCAEPKEKSEREKKYKALLSILLFYLFILPHYYYHFVIEVE